MRNLRSVVTAVSLLGAGMLLGGGVDWAPEALGEVRTGPPPRSFQTGGQLSVPILREIAATLQQMDARLARLELAAKQMQTRGGARGEVGIQ